MELLPTMKRQKGVCQQRPSCFPFLSGSTIMNQIIPWKTRVALKGSLPRASACAWMSTSWRVLPSDRRPKISRSPTVTGIRCHWFFLDDFGSHFRLFDDWLMIDWWCLHWFFSDDVYIDFFRMRSWWLANVLLRTGCDASMTLDECLMVFNFLMIDLRGGEKLHFLLWKCANQKQCLGTLSWI